MFSGWVEKGCIENEWVKSSKKKVMVSASDLATFKNYKKTSLWVRVYVCVSLIMAFWLY